MRVGRIPVLRLPLGTTAIFILLPLANSFMPISLPTISPYHSYCFDRFSILRTMIPEKYSVSCPDRRFRMTLSEKIVETEGQRPSITDSIDLGTDLDILSSAVSKALQEADHVLSAAEKSSWRVKKNAEDAAKRQLEKLRAIRDPSLEPQIPDQDVDAESIDDAIDKPYTHLMDICAEAAKKGIAGKSEGVRVLKEMERLGVMPNSATYTSLLNVLAQAAAHKKSKLRDGLRILAEMKELGLEPSIVSYTALLSLMARSCDHGEKVELKDGWGIISEIETSGLRLDKYATATAMALVAKLVRLGRATPEDAEKLLEKALEAGAAGHAVYNNLLCAYTASLSPSAGSLADASNVSPSLLSVAGRILSPACALPRGSPAAA
jgi:hypothetical protein